MNSRRLILASTLIKISALLLLAFAVAFPDLGGLKAKGLGARSVAYPLGLFALPLLWWLVSRSRVLAFSWAADVVCAVPILVDLLGNRANLFDTVWWWDDAMHFAMHGLLTAGVLLQFFPRTTASQLVISAMAFGGVSGLAWELAEYLIFMRFGVELSGAYLDTLGDLTGGMAGSVLAGIAVSIWSKHQRRASSTRPGVDRQGQQAAKDAEALASASTSSSPRSSALRHS